MDMHDLNHVLVGGMTSLARIKLMLDWTASAANSSYERIKLQSVSRTVYRVETIFISLRNALNLENSLIFPNRIGTTIIVHCAAFDK